MDGRAASQTITDRIPYLIEHGIIPVVISAPTGLKDTRFPHYQTISPSPSGILFELRHIIKRSNLHSFWQSSLKTALLIFCLPFYLPEKIFIHLDSHWSWFLNATRKALPLIKKYRPTLIYSTAGPSSTHLTGYLMHRITGLPWLAELHDPLVMESGSENRQRRKFNTWLERMISAHADGVIFFTENALASAQSRNPVLARKGHVLRPGANPPDFSSASYCKNKQFRFGHFGSLSPGRNLSAFLEIIDELAHECPELYEVLRLDVFGADLDPCSQKALKKMAHPNLVNQHGRLEFDPASGKSGRQRVLEHMRQSDVLLLVHGEGSCCQEYIPSKFYEYLLTRRPVVGIAAEDSELADMLKAASHVMVPKGDREALKSAVLEMWGRWQQEGLPDTSVAPGFTVERTVRSLLEISEGITKNNSSPNSSIHGVMLE